jgi:hypothetical protein
MNTLVSEYIEVSNEIAILPDMSGYGNIYDFQQAIVRDISGQLKSLVEQFIAETNLTARNSLMDQILYKWTDSSGFNPTSRGAFIDARRLATLEKFFGTPYVSQNGSNPIYEAAVLLNDSYRRLSEFYYAQLMGQSHLKSLYEKITYNFDEMSENVRGDLTTVITELQEGLNANPDEAKQILAEFARTLRGFGSKDMFDYLSFREAFIAMDPELGWVIDSAGLKVYDAPHQGTRAWSPHVEGTDNADAVKGALSPVDVNGLNGDDVLYAISPTGDTLINESGNALLVGGGRDTLWAGAGDDILDGGAGNDALYGGYDAGWSTPSGNDTYVFGRGYGRSAFCAEM